MTISTGPGCEPIAAGYFIGLVDTLRDPLDSLNTNVTPRIIALADDDKLTQCLLDLEKCGLKLKVARYSLSDQSPASPHFTRLVNELLERAAAVVDIVDERNYKGDLQKAAQARFDRLYHFKLSSSWTSDSRKLRLPDGSFYNSGT